MEINLILLIALLLVSVWTVMTTRLIHSVVGLALTSAVLSIIMFRLNSPLAAVFELSVCSGLISAIFIITVSFTHRLTSEQAQARRRERLARFWPLPFIIIGAAILLYSYTRPYPIPLANFKQVCDARFILWNKRHLDLVGQIAVLLAASLGVVVLFKSNESK
jgi:NADH-quinone oxidoreductase subunit J